MELGELGDNTIDDFHACGNNFGMDEERHVGGVTGL